jgi:hypothetical protein
MRARKHRIAAALAVLAACGEADGPPSAPAPTSGEAPAAGRAAPADPAPAAELSARIRALEELGYAAGYEDAPGVEGVTLLDAERAMPGLNLVVSAHAAEAVLIDLEGRVVHRWARPFEDTWPGRSAPAERRASWRRAYVLPGGDLLAIFTALGVVRLDRDSELVWAWEGRAHHALDVAGDGVIHVLTRRAAVIPEMHPSEPILEDFVTRLSADGRELGAVSIRDCLAGSAHAAILSEIRGSGDVFHTNAIQWLDGRAAERSPAFARGGVLVSVRQLDLLLVLDLERAGVRWAGRGSWRRQHEPSLLPSGTMLVFDNLSVPQSSGVIEFDPLTGAELWVHRPAGEQRFFSSGCGTCQRLPNGNTLITVSNSGYAFEVTPAGERVWEWHSPYRAGEGGELVATLFDVHRLPEDFDTSWIRP